MAITRHFDVAHLDARLVTTTFDQRATELAAELQANGDVRGEFIELEVALHENRLWANDELDAEDRVRSLERAHRTVWAGCIAEIVESYTYELGLIGAVKMSGEQFVRHAAELVQLAPVIQLELTQPIDMRAICAVPELAQMVWLRLPGGAWLDDRAAETFARSLHVDGLMGIDVRDGAIGPEGARALVGRVYRELVYIDLTGNPVQHSRGDFYSASAMEDHGTFTYIGHARPEILAEAMRVQASGYDVMGPLSWPPHYRQYSYVP